MLLVCTNEETEKFQNMTLLLFVERRVVVHVVVAQGFHYVYVITLLNK